MILFYHRAHYYTVQVGKYICALSPGFLEMSFIAELSEIGDYI
jgi:hypothetical protein